MIAAGDDNDYATGGQTGTDAMDKLIDRVERIAILTAWAGGIIVVIQMVWISYGVFVRYGLGAPDRMVTEATALLLFPVAFAGLAYALREDAYPKVTFLTDLASQAARRWFDIVNHCLMLGVGLFFSYAGISATIRWLAPWRQLESSTCSWAKNWAAEGDEFFGKLNQAGRKTGHWT